MGDLLYLVLTKECPIKCKYCDMEASVGLDNWGITEEFAWQSIEDFYKPELHGTQIISFSGGEPFIKWPFIKRVIEKYQYTFIYNFYTSGYLLTDEILQYLSKYTVSFNLSLDGGPETTNYLRPLRNPSAKGKSYWDRIVEVAPALLYYFPNTAAKVIVSEKTLPVLYKNYLAIERLGFDTFLLNMDIHAMEEPYYNMHRKPEYLQEPWKEKEYEILDKQLTSVFEQIFLGFQQNKKRLLPTQIGYFMSKNALTGRLDTPVCKVYEGKTTVGQNRVDDIDIEREKRGCLQGSWKGVEGNHDDLVKEFDSLTTCPIDTACPFFNACVGFGCPSRNYLATGKYFTQTEDNCKLTKILGNLTVKLILRCLADPACQKSEAFQAFLKEYQI
jgi:sulfatase maturation enzyme AslB (radical SAM superfamily)